MRWSSLFFLIGLFLASAGTAWGQECSVTAASMNFGSYDTTSPAPLDSVTEITVNCESGIAYQIRLDAGQNSTGAFDRRMRAFTKDSLLNYNFYRDSARTEIWGDGTGNSLFPIRVGTGVPERFNVYGRIPDRQNVKADVYSDSVIVTVEW